MRQFHRISIYAAFVDRNVKYIIFYTRYGRLSVGKVRRLGLQRENAVKCGCAAAVRGEMNTIFKRAHGEKYFVHDSCKVLFMSIATLVVRVY